MYFLLQCVLEPFKLTEMKLRMPVIESYHMMGDLYIYKYRVGNVNNLFEN